MDEWWVSGVAMVGGWDWTGQTVNSTPMLKQRQTGQAGRRKCTGSSSMARGNGDCLCCKTVLWLAGRMA